MSRVYDRLQMQLNSEKFKKDAEDCLTIYEKLKEMNNGQVWSAQWQPLTTIVGWVDDEETITAIQPSAIGYVFLKGINKS